MWGNQYKQCLLRLFLNNFYMHVTDLNHYEAHNKLHGIKTKIKFRKQQVGCLAINPSVQSCIDCIYHFTY